MSDHWTYVSHLSIHNSSLQGHVKTNYETLRSFFGSPNIGPGDKTNAEWAISFPDGTIATIYDWKLNAIPENDYDWHIGGYDRRAVSYVQNILKGRRYNEN